MSRRTRSRNAYQSALTAGITNVATSFAVDSASGLDDPCYLCIAPNDPVKREYIKVANITGTTLSGVTRGLAGSTSGGQPHDPGTPVRAIPVHQWIDDLFDDVEDLEQDVTNLGAADSAHAGGTDTADHPEVTASVRGFMSASDKSKLDGIDAGAQADHPGLSGLTTGDPHTQYLKEKASGGLPGEVPLHNHSSSAEGGGVSGSAVDHGTLTGLGDNDHPQYAVLSSIWSTVYPIGSLYFQAGVATNPNTLFGGGTWAAFGAGRVLVGFNAGDTDFDTLEETGGTKTHTHTGPSHTHTLGGHTHTWGATTDNQGSHAHSQGNTGFESSAGAFGPGTGFTAAISHVHVNPNTDGGGTHAHNVSGSTSGPSTDSGGGGTGATGSGSQVQPYIVVHIWKRTA